MQETFHFLLWKMEIFFFDEWNVRFVMFIEFWWRKNFFLVHNKVGGQGHASQRKSARQKRCPFLHVGCLHYYRCRHCKTWTLPKSRIFFVPPYPSNPTIPRHLIKMNGLSCKVRLTSGPSNPGFPWPPWSPRRPWRVQQKSFTRVQINVLFGTAQRSVTKCCR